jgi:hypothetical protein
VAKNSPLIKSGWTMVNADARQPGGALILLSKFKNFGKNRKPLMT